MAEEPFGVERIRANVLAAWAASPARFREDANAEEDLVLGGYRDRLIVELAQNAADAAAEDHQPGRLRLHLAGDTLLASNTGAPLRAAGVQALATLRASAKRAEGTVGRYGVGFAAVLSVTDEPEILSVTGGVRFSAALTSAAAAAIPALADELARRAGAVPVLRLPFGRPPLERGEWTTVVRLPLRPGACELVRDQLAAVDADIMLSLDGLGSLDLDGRVLTRRAAGPDEVVIEDAGVPTRWRVAAAAGRLPESLLAARPVEERARGTWSVRWCVPLTGAGVLAPLPRPQVIHAPTPSDEPLSLPLRLIASYPLGPDRRHVAPGPLTDYVTAMAAAAYVELLTGLGPDPAVLSLVPVLGLAGGELDAALGTAVLAALRVAPWLPGESAARLPPDRAAALDPVSDALVEVLTGVVPGLLPAAWSTRSHARALTALGVARLDPAAVVDLLSAVDRPDRWWSRLYAALDGLGPLQDRDALAALPVPLADGRMAHGIRGLLLPEERLPVAELTGLGLRLVAPAAVHPLLERLGARPATAAGVLADPAVRAAAEASLDEENPEPITAAVLALVAAVGSGAAEHPWLADLALPDADGGWTAAGELVLPGSALAEVLQEGALGVAAAAAVRRWGAATLLAVGVLSGFAVLPAAGAEIGAIELDVDAEQDWQDAISDRLPATAVPPRLDDVVAVRDLELVRADRWPAALALLGELPAEVFAPAVAILGDGSRVGVPSYTRWWLSTHPVLGGRRPDRLRRAGAVTLQGLYDEAPSDAPEFVDLLSTVDDVLADVESALELLHRLGDPARSVSATILGSVYSRLAVALDGVAVAPPDRVRGVTGAGVRREEAVVLDAPYALPLLEKVPVPAVGAAGPVGDLLALPLATELVSVTVESRPVRTVDWASLPGAALAADRLGVPALTGRVALHRPLRVGGRSVPWWGGGAVDHVDQDGGPQALGRALAWRHGRWPLRAALVEALAHPDLADRLRAEDAAG